VADLLFRQGPILAKKCRRVAMKVSLEPGNRELKKHLKVFAKLAA
jgi:hypothetical protein